MKDLPLYSYDYDADFPHGYDAVLHAECAELPGRPQLNAPEAYVSFEPGVFGDDGEFRDEGTAKFLRHYMEEYAAFVERVLAANAPGHIGDLEPDPEKLSR